MWAILTAILVSVLAFGALGAELIVDIDVNDEVVGGILLSKRELAGDHSRWRLKHLAVKSGFQDRGIGRSLVQAAEAITKTLIEEGKAKTAKIEVHVADRIVLPFYKNMGYAEEGVLKDHYRPGEPCYALGKTIR